MKKILKYIFVAVAGIVALAIAGAACLAATFNPNDYKPQAIQLVKDKLNRTLKINGDIKLTFYPAIGADLGGVTLSEQASDKEFAAIDKARVSLQFMPLLSRELVVSRVEVHGVRANLVKHKDGTSNIDDLTGAKPSATKGTTTAPTPATSPNGTPQKPIQFSIDSILIDDTSLGYADEASGAKYTLSKFQLKTGKIAPGTPGDIDLSFALAASAPLVALDVRLKSRVAFATDTGRFKLDGLDFQAKGDAAGMKLAAFSIKGASEGDAKAVQSEEIAIDIDAKQGDKSITGKLAFGLAANLEAQVFELKKLSANVSVTDAKAGGEPIKLSLTGSARADVPKQNVVLDFSTKFDDSTITGKAGVSHFSPPAYTFDLNIDKLDVDRYTAAAGKKSGTTAAAPAAGQPEAPLDFSALKSLQANGSLKIASLKAANLKAQNVRLDLKAANGRVDVNPLSASLYQGTMNGSLSLVAAGTPQVGVKQTLNGIGIGPLLKDLIDKDMLEGKGNVSVDVTGQGATVSAIKKALAGSASLNLADGALKGVNLAELVRKARAAIGTAKGETSQASSASEKTDFTELKASFAIKGGVAHNSDLSMKSPLIRIGGEGDVDIGSDSVNYLVNATLVQSSSGQGGKDVVDLKGVTIPVRIVGPYASPSYKIDFNALLKGAAQQQLEVKKEELKGKATDALKGQLKGLFGR